MVTRELKVYDLSRLSGGDYKLVMEYADVARILRQLIMNQYKFLTERNLNIIIEIPDKPILSLVDVSALERVFVNLLQNAGKYAKSTFNILLKINKERLFVILKMTQIKLKKKILI